MSIIINILLGDEEFSHVPVPFEDYPPINTPWSRNADRVLAEYPRGTHAYWTNFTTLVSDTVPFIKGETELNWLLRAISDERLNRYILDNGVPQYWSEEPGQMKIGERAIFGGPTRVGQSPHRPRSVWTKFKQALGYQVEERGYKRVWNILGKFSYGIKQPSPSKTRYLDPSHPIMQLVADLDDETAGDESDDPSWYYNISYDPLAAALATATPPAAFSAAELVSESKYYCDSIPDQTPIYPAVADDGVFPFE